MASGFDKAGWARAGYTLLLCLVFGVGLVGRIPFQLASFLFMLAFIVSFDFYDNRDAYREPPRMALRVAVAVVIAGGRGLGDLQGLSGHLLRPLAVRCG